MIDGSDDSDSSMLNEEEESRDDEISSSDQKTESDVQNSRRDPIIDEIEELATQ